MPESAGSDVTICHMCKQLLVSKTGNSVIVEAPSGTQYPKITSHMKRFLVDDPVSTPGTPSASRDGVVRPM